MAMFLFRVSVLTSRKPLHLAHPCQMQIATIHNPERPFWQRGVDRLSRRLALASRLHPHPLPVPAGVVETHLDAQASLRCGRRAVSRTRPLLRQTVGLTDAGSILQKDPAYDGQP